LEGEKKLNKIERICAMIYMKRKRRELPLRTLYGRRSGNGVSQRRHHVNGGLSEGGAVRRRLGFCRRKAVALCLNKTQAQPINETLILELL
jgi:hypothetical protein